MNQRILNSSLVFLVTLLVLAGCSKDPVDDLNNTSSQQFNADSRTVKPNPGQEPFLLPAQQKLPGSLPAAALVSQIKWAETDYETMTYNALGQVTQLRSQWQYVQGDPTKIRTIIYDYQYDAQNKPVQITITGGTVVRFYYQNDMIEKTQEVRPSGIVAKEVTYSYVNRQIAQELWHVYDISGALMSIQKHVFSYDARGNLNKVVVYEKDNNQQFKLASTTEYSDFDNKINPESWMLRYPYLPHLRLQFNNPRKKVRRLAVAGQEETTTYAYVYNAEGVPVVKRTTYSSGIALSANYQY